MDSRSPWYRRWFGSRENALVPAAAPGPVVQDAALAIAPDPAARPGGVGLMLRRAFDTIQNLMAGLADGLYDKSSFGAFATVTPLSMQQVGSMYRGDWLARRIINTVADDMTRAWVGCQWDGRDDNAENDTSDIDRLDKVESDLGLRKAVNQALRWARAYGGAGIVIGIRGEDLSLPLDPATVKRDSLAMLYVVDRWRIAPTGMLDPELGQHFGQPLTYILADTAQLVHWTRFVQFDGDELPWMEWRRNGLWHDSVLQSLVDNVRDYSATRQAMASLVYESNVDIVRADGLANQLASADGTALATKRFQLAARMKSINRIYVLDKEDEYEQKTVAFAGVNAVLETFMQDVCGAADIPMTRLFGRSPGGLNSTGDSDLRNYYDHISAKQESAMRPQLRRLYEVIVRSALGAMPKDFTFIFHPLWQTSDLDRATIDKLRAETDGMYIDQGAMTAPLVARELLDRGTYKTLTDEDLAAVEEAAELKEQQSDAAAKASAAALAQLTGGKRKRGAPGAPSPAAEPAEEPTS